TLHAVVLLAVLQREAPGPIARCVSECAVGRIRSRNRHLLDDDLRAVVEIDRERAGEVGQGRRHRRARGACLRRSGAEPRTRRREPPRVEVEAGLEPCPARVLLPSPPTPPPAAPPCPPH